MSKWGVQLVIGKLLTDEEFRQLFEARPYDCLAALRSRGIDLADAEISALAESAARLWSTLASRIDRRLRETAGDVPGARPSRPFTIREQRVLRGVFDGLTNKQIAADLGVSESAVKATLQHLFRKAHVRTRTQLVRVALEDSAIQRGR